MSVDMGSREDEAGLTYAAARNVLSNQITGEWDKKGMKMAAWLQAVWYSS